MELEPNYELITNEKSLILSANIGDRG